jgi:putative ABC transport system permease protein
MAAAMFERELKKGSAELSILSLVESRAAGLVHDVRYGIRSLAKSPGLTAVIVLTLALGIGANTAVFSVFHGVLLNPLPYPDAARLVWLWPANARTGQSYPGALSAPDFLDYRQQSTVFEHLAAFLQVNVTLSGSGEAERVPTAAVSSGFFETFGVQPQLGRVNLLDDERKGWPQTAILSHGLWSRRFSGDPQVVGRSIVIDGKSVTVAGVMPAGFEFPKGAELWQPAPFGYVEMQVRRFHFLHVVGRLKPGISIGRADAQMKSICASLARIYPDSNADSSTQVVGLLDRTVGTLRPTLRLLMAAVCVVLLIACANVAHLLLARAAARQKEIAIRSSLGASTGRVLRQLLAESLLLAAMGGLLGCVLAGWELRALTLLHPANLPRLDEARLSGRVFAFTAGLSMVTGLLFGLIPALRAARPNLTEALKGSRSGGSAGRGHQRFHNALVAAEVAFAVVLLAGAALLLRSLQRLENVNPGFDSRNVLTMRVELPMSPAADASEHSASQREGRFFKALAARLEALPGVESAGFVSELPLSGQGNDRWFTIDGRPPLPINARPNAEDRAASTGYFHAMHIPLLKGRYFREDAAGVHEVLISRSLAETYFPGQDPLGQRLAIDHGFPFHCEIVGVVGDVLHRSLAEKPHPTMYTQEPGLRSVVVIRARANILGMALAARKEVQALDAAVPVFDVHSMGDLVSDSVGPQRFRTVLLGVFAALALLLAAAGIYGVMSYSVSLRTHELGIRAALGASRADLMKAVVGRSMFWTLAGVAIGLAAALGLGRLIQGMLFEVRPADSVSFLAVPAILASVAFLASYLPARRATRVDAIVALRYE